MTGIRRRDLITGTALVLVGETLARAEVISGKLPWRPDAGVPPHRVQPGPWKFFTLEEAAAVQAAVDRLIPPDPQTPGGRDAGCAVFIDRQLAGGYGHHEGLYTRSAVPGRESSSRDRNPPRARPTCTALPWQRSTSTVDRTRTAEAARRSTELRPEQHDEILRGLETGSLKLEGVDAKKFFEQLLKDTQQGFFADPIYGGNRDMCAWKMIGFPGARYDYRDWVGRHNERYPHPPVSIGGRADWTPPRA